MASREEQIFDMFQEADWNEDRLAANALDEITRLRKIVRMANSPLVAYGFPLAYEREMIEDADMRETLERALRSA